jgi:sugar transferase (PEP-CTERM/EpsH1 system associated)
MRDTGRSPAARDARPLIAHVLFRFDIGGLENGVVNLLNRMPRSRYRHAVIALTDVTAFRERVAGDDVEFVELHKAPGHGFRLFPRLHGAFRRLRPDIVHTRNLAALEASVPAWLARVPVRIHGEHGRDIGDLDGSRRAYRVVRRAYRPFVDHYVAVSEDLRQYLVDAIGVPEARVTRIVNGVDTERFHPAPVRGVVPGCPFGDPAHVVIGTVGRLAPVKNQAALARAFVRALALAPELRARARLVIVGDGPLRPEIVDVLARANASGLAWLPGARNDVADVMRALDVFVLPSLAEGISNTILEALACGLPVVATRVGGNAELLGGGSAGTLVPAADEEALARAIVEHARTPDRARSIGRSARSRAESLYGIDAMVAGYGALYDALLSRRRTRAGDPVASAATASRAPTEIH